jgi:hypothetical protein
MLLRLFLFEYQEKLKIQKQKVKKSGKPFGKPAENSTSYLLFNFLLFIL